MPARMLVARLPSEEWVAEVVLPSSPALATLATRHGATSLEEVDGHTWVYFSGSLANRTATELHAHQFYTEATR